MTIMFRNSLIKLATKLNTLKYNILFYVSGIAILYFNFRLFFGDVERQIDGTSPSSIFLHLSTCLFLSLPYFWVKRKKEILIYILFFINSYLICNLLYYRTYFTILPLDSYSMIGNLNGLADSIISAFHYGDSLYLLPTIALFILYKLFLGKRIVEVSRKVRLSNIAVISIVVLYIISYNLYIDRNEVSNLLSDENEFKYDVVDGASTYGFLHCWVWQCRTLFEMNPDLTASEKTTVEKWLARHKQVETVDSTYSNKGKNLIMVIVESLESFPIGKKLAGQEITPFLNSLVGQQQCFYAPHLIPQVNIGHSSDTQLIFNTGMLPPHNGAACFKYQHNTYHTLAKALHDEGYNSHTLLGGNGSFWNQGVMNNTLGYDELIAIEQFRDDESYDFGLTDSTFLAQSVEKVCQFKQPFLAQLITLSSHDPYVLINNRQYLHIPNDCPPEMGRYLNAVHYVDKCLRLFVDGLRKNGVLSKSVLLISGDHDGTKQQPAQWKKYAAKHWSVGIGQTPLFILNSAFTGTYTGITGQVDVYPTLLELMGLKNYAWRGLGQCICGRNKAAFAVNARFAEFGDTKTLAPATVNQIREAWEVSDLMIRKNYFANAFIK